MDGWLALADKDFYERAFTPLITLWYLVFQRLCDNHHLSQVQEDALEGGADRLTHKAFRVPEKFGLKLGLIDGSTCRLRPFGDIPKHFPPHRPGNCKKPPYWCLARVVGIFCWATGVVLDNAMASPKISEQALCAQLLRQRSWQGWLLAADRNFGVYFVARALVAAQAQALLRLTAVRARRLARAEGLKLKPGLDAPINWRPTRHDQCPEGLTPTPLAGRLLAVRVNPAGFRAFTLYLFTTLGDRRQYPAGELAAAYGERWNIELCFRYIKSQMELGLLECHSAQMARKEWLAGLIAYNLIRWTMAAAGALAAVPVQSLSFSRARELFGGWCFRTAVSGGSRSWKRLLTRIAKARLPKRRKRRPSEPRAIRWFQKNVAKLEGSRVAAREKLAQANAKS